MRPIRHRCIPNGGSSSPGSRRQCVYSTPILFIHSLQKECLKKQTKQPCIDHKLIRRETTRGAQSSNMGCVYSVGPIERNERNVKPLSATDVLAPTTMKNAAKCDTSCELQNPVSHQNFERNLHFPREVCLLECLFSPHPPAVLKRATGGVGCFGVLCTEPSSDVRRRVRVRTATCVFRSVDDRLVSSPVRLSG